MTKTAIIGRMLARKRGTTFAEVLEATGWKSVGLPVIAKRLGLKLRRERKPGSRAARFYAA